MDILCECALTIVNEPDLTIYKTVELPFTPTPDSLLMITGNTVNIKQLVYDLDTCRFVLSGEIRLSDKKQDVKNLYEKGWSICRRATSESD